jgi:hypothetical protein
MIAGCYISMCQHTMMLDCPSNHHTLGRNDRNACDDASRAIQYSTADLVLVRHGTMAQGGAFGGLRQIRSRIDIHHVVDIIVKVDLRHVLIIISFGGVVMHVVLNRSSRNSSSGSSRNSLLDFDSFHKCIKSTTWQHRYSQCCDLFSRAHDSELARLQLPRRNSMIVRSSLKNLLLLELSLSMLG